MRLLSTLVLLLAVASASGAQTPRPELLLSATELAAFVNHPNLVILHVADRETAFAEGHLPGARFVRYGDFAVEGERGLGSELPAADQLKRVFEAAGVSDTSRVVIYAASAVTAARAFFTLDAAGHPHVALLDGGLNAWKAGKRPVETGPPSAVKPGSFTPRINAALKTED